MYRIEDSVKQKIMNLDNSSKTEIIISLRMTDNSKKRFKTTINYCFWTQKLEDHIVDIQKTIDGFTQKLESKKFVRINQEYINTNQIKFFTISVKPIEQVPEIEKY